MTYSLDLMSAKYIGLAWKFHVSPNSCANPDHYEEYLKFCAISDQKEGMGVTRIILEHNEAGEPTAIVGFVTLRATSLVSKGEDGKNIVHPSLEIAELAVAEEYEKQGFGSQLVNLAVLTAAKLREEFAGVRYVVLCADNAAIGFYDKQHFGKIGELYETPRDGWNNNCEPMYISLVEI